MKTKVVGGRADENTYNRLVALAARQGISLSSFVLKACLNYEKQLAPLKTTKVNDSQEKAS